MTARAGFDEQALDDVAAAAMGEEDPIAAVDAVAHAVRERVLREALLAESWNLNAAARRLRRRTSTVQYALERTYPALNAERLRRLKGR
jgi:hypothetical protein